MTSLALIHVVLALVAIEVIALMLIIPRRWPHLSRTAVMANLAAGATLMLALRAVASGASTAELALWLVLALVAHLVDLGLRLSRRA
jgi:hypothetical protein